MNVLSLFDGMSCGQIALDQLGVKVNNYFASEIKQHAIKVTRENYPNTKHIGDVTKWETWNLPKIDLLIGGSPCQDFSNLKCKKDRLGLDGSKSSLFFYYLDILKNLKPKYFLLENVRMSTENKILLDNYLGVDGIYINSKLVSYQTRDRCYWTNIPGDASNLINKNYISQPRDLNINFQDFKETDYNICKKRKVNKTKSRVEMYEKTCKNVTAAKKVNCLTCKQDRRSNSGLIDFDGFCRFLTRKELELAQTVPVGYTDCLSINQAEDVLGDGWTVSVIKHIFKGLLKIGVN